MADVKKMILSCLLKTLVLIFLGLPALAEEKKLDSKLVSKIVIKSKNLKLSLKKTGKKQVHVLSKGGDFDMKLEKGVLKLLSSSFNSKKGEDPGKTPVLEISGVPKNIEVFSQSLDTDVSSWSESVFIFAQKGSFKSKDSKGDFNLSLKKGNLKLENHEGLLFVQSLNSKIEVLSSKADMKFFLNEGSLRVKKSSGQAEFVTDKARVSFVRFKGDLTGQSQYGSTFASLRPKEKVDLKVEHARLFVNFLGHSARIQALTEKGKIFAPKYMRKRFSGKSTKVKALLKGKSKAVQASLQTLTGNIHIQ